MNQTFFRGLTISFLVTLTYTMAWGDNDHIKLPDGKNAVAITLDMFGRCEFGNRKNDEPLMAVRADGSVQVGSPYDYQSRAKGSISVGELKELLSFMIKEQDFSI